MCIFAAAKTYAVPSAMLLGVLSAEGGAVGERTPEPDRSYDLGLLQINSSWAPQLAKVWEVDADSALHMLRDDACINVGMGAWLLLAALDKNTPLQNHIPLYHAAAHNLTGKTHDDAYVGKVIKMMELYKNIHGPEDLLKK